MCLLCLLYSERYFKKPQNAVNLPLSYVIEKINAIPLLMSDKQVKYILQRQKSNPNEQEFKSCHSMYVQSDIFTRKLSSFLCRTVRKLGQSTNPIVTRLLRLQLETDPQSQCWLIISPPIPLFSMDLPLSFWKYIKYKTKRLFITHKDSSDLYSRRRRWDLYPPREGCLEAQVRAENLL